MSQRDINAHVGDEESGIKHNDSSSQSNGSTHQLNRDAESLLTKLLRGDQDTLLVLGISIYLLMVFLLQLTLTVSNIYYLSQGSQQPCVNFQWKWTSIMQLFVCEMVFNILCMLGTVYSYVKWLLTGKCSTAVDHFFAGMAIVSMMALLGILCEQTNFFWSGILTKDYCSESYKEYLVGSVVVRWIIYAPIIIGALFVAVMADTRR